MTDTEQAHYISIETLALAFMSLPVNPDKRLLVIGFPIALPTEDGQLTTYQLLFDWNDLYNDWELNHTQKLIITALPHSPH